MDGTANHFPAKNALDCRILHIRSQKIFRGQYPPDPRRIVPGAWTQTPFPIGSPAFPSFLFYETTARALYSQRQVHRLVKSAWHVGAMNEWASLVWRPTRHNIGHFGGGAAELDMDWIHPWIG